MILFPKVGRVYWYITDAWEEFFAVPVKIESRGGLFKYCNKTPALWRVRWELAPPNAAKNDPGYFEEFDASRRELFKTEKRAAKIAAKLNKKLREARQREDY